MPSLEPVQKLPPAPGALSPYQKLLRPMLFKFDPEFVHDAVVVAGKLAQSVPMGNGLVRWLYGRKAQDTPVTLAGIKLRNPLGLAAGFDKNAVVIPLFENLGFGFVEVGTITPRPQLGNPRPRIIRVPDKRAIVNRMGFNNDGIDAVALNLQRMRSQVKIPIGVNLGKNRDTPNSDAVKDYERLFRSFQFAADYFTVNISSPNTPGLRDLQSEAFVQSLGERVTQLRETLGLSQPVFIKLAPDLPPAELGAIAAMCGSGKPFTGLVLTNTQPTDLGGVSGYPLRNLSLSMLKAARMALASDVPVISVGGIESAADVIERFENGADAVQLYTALIYQGPGVAARIQHDLHKLMHKRGIKSLTELRQR